MNSNQLFRQYLPLSPIMSNLKRWSYSLAMSVTNFTVESAVKTSFPPTLLVLTLK